MELIIIRHGQTPGNAERKYVGIQDQPLSEQGRAEAAAAGSYPHVGRVYVSPLKRTHETAAIMFPNAEQVIVQGVEEMDFGDFVGRSADEMADDEAYRAWVDSYCEDRCPHGESRAEFTDRVCESMHALILEADGRGETRIVLVAHGGTMMATLSRYADDGRQYWEWLVGNCEGYRIDVEIEDGEVSFGNVEKLDPNYL